MITLIGYQDDTIGFGLVGIPRIIELKRNASKDIVMQAVLDSKEDSKAIFINETLLAKIKGHPLLEGVNFVEIPEDKENTHVDEVEKLVKETLGVNI